MTDRDAEERAGELAKATAPRPVPGRSPRAAPRTRTPVPRWVRILLAGAAALFVVLTLDRLLWSVAYPLSLIFTGVVIAQGLDPVASWLARFLPRPVAVVGLYLALVAVVGTGVWLFLPVLAAQGEEFAATLPGFGTSLRALAASWDQAFLSNLADVAQSYLARVSGLLLELPVAALSIGTNLVLVVFLSLYWLIAQPEMRGWALSLVTDEHRDDLRELLGEVGATMGGYVRGVMISALSIGLLTFAGLLLLGMPSPLVLAVLAGIGELIPILGPFLAAVPAFGVALATGVVNPLAVLAFYVALQQVESNLLVPQIMRGQARIPPLLSLIAFLIGAAVGGFVGAVIAIPLFGALRVIVVRVLVPAQRDLVGVSDAEAKAVRREEAAREAGDEPGLDGGR